jgi:hypothetical protein
MKTIRLLAIALALTVIAAIGAADLRIGMIGLDTSHVTAFTKLLNDPADPNHVPGGRVVAAFKGGSPDIESSRSRVDGYTKELQDQWGVKIVGSIEALCGDVDVVMLESVDGRPHLEQARPVLKARKHRFATSWKSSAWRGRTRCRAGVHRHSGTTRGCLN